MTIEAFFSNYSPYVIAGYAAAFSLVTYVLNKLNNHSIRLAILENEGKNTRGRLERMEMKIDDILTRLPNKNENHHS